MSDRLEREQLEQELLILRREVDEAEESIYESVRLFYRVQDAAYEDASRHGVFDGEVKRVLEQNQDEFFEVKRDADRLVECKQEECDRLAAKLADL
ncbi:hypothetical protein G7067_12520 [Leucobacter insecticola]|uniref:Uncharacterized protein n=1 Tax=Leucobacter insecticola TaxID=2714934 RepID=A0A6G8FL11_9MICO|nr:hypothetical protein [Leucobacter insecticola]QIM17041.1 hypothetical protein G7067_12520 [Leucobacter insecticola]